MRLQVSGALLLSCAALVVLAFNPAPSAQMATRTIVFRPIKHDLSPPLTSLPVSMDVGEEDEATEAVHAPLPIGKRDPRVRRGPVFDAAAETAPVVSLLGPPTVSFEGVPQVNGALPPDVNGDVGPNHYVQWINLSFAVFNKTGGIVAGPMNGNTLFAGFGGPCQTTNNGDPIVLYDHLADRWFLTQFALPNFPNGPFYQCIAVSQTSNPAGAYYRYQYSFPKMNDYGKFGVWPDGYYMAINQFTAGTLTWAGQGVAVFERTKMLVGQSARMLYTDKVGDTSLGAMLPADLDGPAPPAGTPNMYVQVDEGAQRLQVWELAANWTAGTSSFTRRALLSVPPFNILCSGTRNCIPQPSTATRLDGLGDRLMYRLQYRNVNGVESLVTNHSADITGSGRAGVRWYEIRKSGSSYSLYQAGTFSPDATNRWMGSAAMDAAGNIAVAYNTSSGTEFPSIRFAGRLPTDPLGQLAQGETDIFNGTGSQTHSSSRWGDYSMLAVDPVDGCRFWATLEYLPTTSSANWHTRVAAFTLPNCPLAPASLVALSPTTTRVDLSWTDTSPNETSFVIERCLGGGCTGFASIGTVGGNVTTYTDTTVTTGQTYQYRVRSQNSASTSNPSNVAAVIVDGTASALVAGPASLKFGVKRTSGVVTALTNDQTVTVTFTGVSHAWTAFSPSPWVHVTGGSGSGTGSFTVSINPGVLPASPATLSTSISITAPGVYNSPLIVPLQLTQASTTAAAFGQVDTPAQNVTGIQGALGVTGWALDDVGVSAVQIYRKCLSFDAPASCQSIGGVSVVYVTDAIFLAGARPDVEAAFSSSPQPYRGGWGALLLTNMLPDVTRSLAYGGQGALTIYCYALDFDGHRTLLGRTQVDHTPTTFTMTNDTIAKPFGTIDTPSNGQVVSGSIANFGWALTPDSDTGADPSDILVPTDGSTMTVFIDGLPVSLVTYNQCRGSVGTPVPGGSFCDDDISNIFGNTSPQPALTARSSNATRYRNLDQGRGAIGAYIIDTTSLSTGLHTLAWSVADSASRLDGLGSRLFYVLNTGSSPVAASPARLGAAVPSASRVMDAAATARAASAMAGQSGSAALRGSAASVASLPTSASAVGARRGFDLRARLTSAAIGLDGIRTVKLGQLDRLELSVGSRVTAGYVMANGTLRDLPVGSHLDKQTGVFTWVPPPGYLGVYHLVFVTGHAKVPVDVAIR